MHSTKLLLMLLWLGGQATAYASGQDYPRTRRLERPSDRLIRSAALTYEGGRVEEVPASQPTASPTQAPVLTKPPSLTSFSPAAYPPEASGRGVVTIDLLIFIDTDGRVTKAEWKRPSELAAEDQSFDVFARAAEAAAMGLLFSAAEVDGKPSAIGLEFRYTFTEDLAASAPSSEPASAPTEVAGAASQPAGRGVVSVEVREAGTRVRLEDVAVHVSIDGFEADGISDAKGKVRFEALPPGTAVVTFAAPKYNKESRIERIDNDVETAFKIYLQRERQDPYETIVRGKKDTPEVVRRVISREELRKVPGTFGDPLRVVQNLPGVARPPFFSGQLIVRGANPNSSSIMVDGMEIPILYHFGAGPSVLPERMIDEVSFVPGNFTSRYGRATAGIVDVKTRELTAKQVSGRASIDIGLASGFIEVPITDNTSIAIAGRRSYIDLVLPAVLPRSVGGVSNPILQPVFWDYQLRFSHRSKELGEFSLFWFGSDDALRFAQTPTQSTSTFNPADLRVNVFFHSLQPRWVLKIGKDITNTLTVAGTFEGNHARTPDITFGIDRYRLNLREELVVKLSKTMTFTAGLDGQLDGFRFNARIPFFQRFPQFPVPGREDAPLRDIRSTGTLMDLGWYGELDWQFGRLRVTPGVRFEQHAWFGRVRQALQPRVTASYKLTDEVSLKAGVGLYHKQPEPNFISSDIGNPELELEGAVQSSLGAAWQITQALSLDTTLFFNYLFDEPTGSTAFSLVGNRIVPKLFESSQIGRTFGGELLLRHRPYKGFFGWIAYTLSRSERNNPNEKQWFLFNFDQTHILTLVASYILPYNFQLGARFRLISGNPATPVVGSVFDADTGGYQRLNGATRSVRLPMYHQLDVRLDRKWVFDWWSLTVYLDVQNVYNQMNAEFFQYSFDFSQRQFFTGLPILPFLGVEGEF